MAYQLMSYQLYVKHERRRTSPGERVAATIETFAALWRRVCGRLPYLGDYRPFFSSQAFICAISFSCAATMSVANWRNSGSVPYWSSTLAMSTAPR